MTDQNPLETNGDDANPLNKTEIDESANDEIDDTDGNECYQFLIEGEEMLDDAERECLQKAAKKYEPLIDKLFDENVE